MEAVSDQCLIVMVIVVTAALEYDTFPTFSSEMSEI